MGNGGASNSTSAFRLKSSVMFLCYVELDNQITLSIGIKENNWIDISHDQSKGSKSVWVEWLLNFPQPAIIYVTFILYKINAGLCIEKSFF